MLIIFLPALFHITSIFFIHIIALSISFLLMLNESKLLIQIHELENMNFKYLEHQKIDYFVSKYFIFSFFPSPYGCC